MSTGHLSSSGVDQQVKIHREGLSIVASPSKAEIDIVILHGLKGNPYGTFKSTGTGFYWPSHIQQHLPCARIMVFGYLADIVDGSNNSLGVYQHAESLLLHLKNLRLGSELRPLIFVGHSLGGLVIKQTLVISSHRPMDLHVLSSTKAVLFLGTPHRGSYLLEKSMPKIGLSLAKAMNREIPVEVKSMLQPRTNESFIANSDFMRIKGPISIINFYEQLKTPGLGALVVDKDSAVFDSEHAENIPVARSHHQLVKYDSADDDIYRTLYQTLQRITSQIISETNDNEHESTITKLSQECIASLATSHIWHRQDLLDGPHRASLQWLWQDKSDFAQWLASDSGFFQITGKPGSGKSILMSSIVAKAKQYHKADIIIQHFFNSRGQALEHSFDGFLRSLLEQILRREPSLIQYMVEEWRATQEQSPDFPKWTLPLLKEALMKVLVHGSQYTHFLLILDALDEYDGLRGEMDILSFLSMVNTSSKSSHLRIVFSCRYSPDIGIPNIMGGFRMEQRNEADITSLVNDEWSLIFPPDSMTEELHEVKRTIIQKADGVFLWVRLALQGVSGVVREGGTVAEIKETIDDIPSELSNMYEMLLSRVGDKHKKETYLMLSVVLASRRPLTLTEFKLVMGLCTGEFECLIDMERSNTVISNDSVMQKRIRSRSGGLLEVKATGETWRQDAKAGRTMNGGIVQLIHQSVKDFLLVHEEDTKSTFPNQDRLVANGHEKLAQACLRYLKMREISSLQRQWVSTANESVISEEYPLLFYSISNWRWHCQQAERLGLPQVDLIRQTFDFETGTFSHWLELYNALCPAEPLSTDYTLYQLAVHDNLATLLEYFCKTGELDVNAWTEAGNKSTYLFHAVSEGCKESVKVLLEYGANPDAGGLEHGTPILLACVLGYVDIARMLLEAGAEFQGGLDPYGLSSEFPGFAMLYRPIAMAAYSGNADVINLIIQYDPGAVVNHWHRQYAVLCLVIGAKEAVESFPEKERESQFLSRVSKLLPLLLGGDYSETEIFDSTMILYVCAVRGYSKKSLDMFLNTQYASRAEGFTKMIAQICSHGPLSALQYLVEYCSVEMVQNMMIEDYGNLLHAAVFNPHTSVIVYLLDLGLDIDAQDSSGQTPLHYASARSSGAHIELLLTRGADGTIRDNQGFTAFHLALMNPYLRRSISILEQLMSSSKEDAHSSSRDGVKPLHLAAAAGWLPTVEWLLKNGADIKCSDDLGRTALHTAASSMGLDSIDIVKFLINHGLSATDQDEGGMTPLHHVFYTYDKLDPDSYDPDVSLVIARYLLQQGADPAIQDSEGNTVLHLAAWRGHVGIVKTLIQSGVDTSVTNNANQKPIDNAWSEDIRKLLEL